MVLHPIVFKAYDVRGKVPDELDAQGAGRVAEAFTALLQSEGVEAPRVVVGQDARSSSADLEQQVAERLAIFGARVLRIGKVTTPLFYFAINHLQADGGIMITASHNPLPFNGLKMCRSEARAIGAGQGMEEVREFALGTSSLPEGKGSVVQADVWEAYLSFLVEQADMQQPLTVAFDAGNGMAGLVLEKLLPRLQKLAAAKLYFDIDFTFPNHEANPIKEETLTDLKKAVAEHGADAGVAFDGDVDRVGFVTGSGEYVRGDFITALLAKEMLRDATATEAVLYEVRSSKVVPEAIKEVGGEPVLVKPGHAAINAVMRERNAVLAGELSGHYYFRDFFFRDDGIFAMLRILNLIARGKTLDEYIAPLRRYVQSGEINFEVSDKQGMLTRVADAFADGELTRVDGITVTYEDWWFNLRPSNTEDVLRLNVEADTEAILEEKLEQLKRIVEEK